MSILEEIVFYSMADSKQVHVMLVEDDIFLANIYKTKFEMEGFKVSTADNGETGLEEVKKKRPDVVLLDILLPKMDGFAVLSALKSDPELKGIPVILLTNLGQKDDVDKGIELGAVDYLIKAHFKPSETVEKVKQALKR
ncbi:MAG: Two component transcriptional regulator, winged helix family [Candidatus Magasanikbacteria bacterium GW2011_GWA2_56_11]|uniref:Two component transcriptional regulator, winged helix family n=1 Tax=Candidatus Magasanikbacteria bacterium GW2011_GWA2_56_11 TaxID=1619044 RepID=A0A0G2BAE7_9BACT|nr:MAG: Two component transcriptional regulator, winged helix family [Candidatus Magasanikbacteria bacterium GW2011_GWA2_56_11]